MMNMQMKMRELQRCTPGLSLSSIPEPLIYKQRTCFCLTSRVICREVLIIIVIFSPNGILVMDVRDDCLDDSTEEGERKGVSVSETKLKLNTTDINQVIGEGVITVICLK